VQESDSARLIVSSKRTIFQSRSLETANAHAARKFSTARSSHSRAVHSRSEKLRALCQRTPAGRTQRSPAARRDFQASPGRATGACPGYVFDHVIPLKRGGPDVPGEHAVADD
jgi:hypothetical protein